MRIFVVGGGTGGHLFPAIALGEELKARGNDVHLITDTRCKNYLNDCQLTTHIMHLGFMRKGILPKILLCVRMILAIARSIALLICYRPQVVVGFGGYTAFPMMLAARLLFIPIVLHEQNCFLGKVNDMFARSAVKIALNFAETANVPTSIGNKIVITGNPVRKEIRESRPATIQAKKSGVLNILVIGGSQGAQIFSEIVPSALEIVRAKNPKLKLSITAQATSDSRDDLQAKYKDLKINAEIQPFFHEMTKRYLASDLVICRSGASTIAELIYLGKPAIMIPLPSAAEDHQTFNARTIEAKGGGWTMIQSEVTPKILADKILELASNREELNVAALKIFELCVPSEKILADTVEEIIKV